MVNGAIGRANGVTGNNYITVPYNASFTLPGDYSVGAWIWPSSTSDQGILGTYTTGFILALYQGYLQFYDGNGWRSSGVSAASLLNAWQYVVYARSGTTNRFYINGANVATLATGSGVTGGGNLTFGRANTWGATYNVYSGPLDEVRIVRAVCSTNWAWAEYVNMVSNQTFQTYNAVESVQASAPSIANQGAFNIQATTADLVGNLSSGVAPVTVTCYWGTNDGGVSAVAWMTNAPSSQATPPATLTNTVTGLTAGKTYYFRYVASNSVDVVWASSSTSFVTPGAPSVTNLAPANISPTGARLQGQVLSGGPNPNTWIYWGTNDGAAVKGNWSQAPLSLGSVGAGPFYADVANLPANQTYWYRCYVSNSFNSGSEAWAPASTVFTTAMPSLTIADTGVLEGNSGTTPAVFTVTLSAASAVSVSVGWGTSDGTALASDNDYQPASGTLTIQAGVVTGAIPVAVVGDTKYESNEVFYVNVSNAVNATIARSPAAGVISNDDYACYVRGDGQGNDANGGSGWADAFATLSNALAVCPKAYNNTARTRPYSGSTPFQVFVQGSTGTQSYAGASCTPPGNSTLDVDVEGGWTYATGIWTQTGVSVVNGGGTTGLYAGAASHYAWKRVAVNRFLFTNVTRGIVLVSGAADDSADVMLTVSNTTIYATNDGVNLSYPKGYANWASQPGGLCQVRAGNVDIRAGLGGAGYGIYSCGSWTGSCVTASGNDPLTGAPRVSTISSASGCGIYLFRSNSLTAEGPEAAVFSNVAVYSCASTGIVLAAAGADPIQLAVSHATLADNGGDGLAALATNVGSLAVITNSLLSANAGRGVFLGTNGFTCAENNNVVYSNNLVVNGSTQAPAASTSTNAPVFWARGTKADPWYRIASASSPAYHSAGDGADRGAYQTEKAPEATNLTVSTLEDTPVNFGVPAIGLNSGATLGFTNVATPVHGTLSAWNGSNVTYSPIVGPHYYGTDTFTFVANEGPFISNTGTVSVVVTHMNHAPVVSDMTVTVRADQATSVAVSGTDVDAGDVLNFTNVTTATHGTLGAWNGSNVTYTLSGIWYGTESFKFVANDGQLNSSTGTVTVLSTPVAPEIANGGSSNVTAYTATLWGTLSVTGAGPTLVSCWYGTNGAALDHGTTPVAWLQGTTNNVAIGGLSPATTYSYRFFATNTGYAAWAPTTNAFTTMALPTIGNAGATSITETSATLQGFLSNTGSAAATVYCYWWKVGDSVTNSASPVAGVIGAVSQNVSSLDQGMSYGFTFMASNQYGVAWATNGVLTFATLQTAATPPLIVTPGASAIGPYTATLGAYLSATGGLATTVTCYWGTNTAALENSGNLGLCTVGPVATNVTGLNHSTVYSFAFMASNATGTTYTVTNSFRTQHVAPKIANGTATALSSAAATLCATLQDLGGDGTNRVWAYWGTTAGTWTGSSNLTDAVGTGAVSLTVSGLNSNALYYCTFMASNADVAGWAPTTNSFALLPALAGGMTVSNVQASSATIYGTLLSTGGAPVHVLALYRTPAANLALTNDSGVFAAGPVSVTLTNLDPNSVCTFTLMASNAAGVVWSGQTNSFVLLPALGTPATGMVTAGSADLIVPLLSTGGAPVTVWSYWGTNAASWSSVSMGVRVAGLMTNTVSGLGTNVQYSYAFMASNSAGVVWSATNAFQTLATLPAVVNTGASNVTRNAAALCGSVTVTGGVPTTVFCYWGTNAGAWSYGSNLGVRGVGAVSNVVTSLQQNTAYYYQYLASNSVGTSWASANTPFTTAVSFLTLTNNQDASTGAVTGINSAGVVETVRTNALDPTLFWWADENGDNTPGDQVSAGLNMAGYNLVRADGVGITLNLNDGMANGSITNGGTITTSRNGVTGGITITNAASVRLYAIDTHNQGAYSSGAIQLVGVGDVNVTSLVAALYGGNNLNGGILVQQQGNLVVGSITNATGTGSSYLNGPTTLIGGGPNAGVCSIGSVYAVAGQGNDVTISNYQAVLIGAGGIDVHAQSVAYSPGSIFIRNIGLGGVTIAGNVTMTNGGGYAHSPSGLVVTAVFGPVSVMGKIDGSRVSPSSVLTPCVTISATGSVSLAAIDLSVRGPYVSGNWAAGSVSIVSATGSVTVGSIAATNNLGNYPGCGGGSVSIQSVGDLTLTGSVSLASARTNETGVLALKAIGAGSRISVQDLDCQQFRSVAGTNTIDAAGGESYINGQLLNFTTTATGGVGSVANPYLTTQTVLRLPAGQKLYYRYSSGATNDYLGGRAYRVADANGNASQGGLLMVAGAPDIATFGAVNIATNGADLVGNLTAGNTPATVICYWGTNDGGTVAAAWATNNSWTVSALGLVTNRLGNLPVGRAYYFRYFASNAGSVSWATNSSSFSTYGPPQVDNGSGAAYASQRGVLLSGTVTGGNPVPQVWFYWGTANGGTDVSAWNLGALPLGASGLGPVSTNWLGNLTAGATYWYRCYASNAYGVAWAPASASFTPLASYLTLTNDQDVTGGMLTGSNSLGLVESLRTNAVDATLFWWADEGGDNAPGDKASIGLNMAGHNLTRVGDAVGITLNLNDGLTNGSITNGGKISTVANLGGFTGSIVITNAASVQVASIDTHSLSSYHAGAIRLMNVGDVTANSLVCGLANQLTAGITVQQTGNLTIGAITNTTYNNGGYINGPIMLTGGGTGAGACSIGSINQAANGVGDVTIQNYQAVTIGANGIDAHNLGAGTPGSVTIRNIGVGGVAVGGNILACYAPGAVNGGTFTQAGVIITNIAGSVTVGNIDTHSPDWNIANWHNVTIGAVNIAAVGSVSAGNLTTYFGSSQTGGKNAGNISVVSSAGSVTVGAIDARQAKNDPSSYAGSAVLTAYGNIAVTGSISLVSANTNTTGVLALKTTGPGSRIMVQDLDCLQCRVVVGTNTFDAAGGVSYINGTLSNFDTLTCTRLSTPAGQSIYYSTLVAGNAYLGAASYTLAGGGVLRPIVLLSIANVAASNVNVGAGTADLIGNITTSTAPTTVTCYWGTNDGGTNASAWLTNASQSVSGMGLVTNSVSGLLGNATYRYRFFASNSVTWVWASNTAAFSTQAGPLVDNAGGAVALSPSSERLRGTVLAGSPDPNVWIYWGTSDGGSDKTAWARTPISLGATPAGGFAFDQGGLLANTQYWYRCYASNVNGEAWAMASSNVATLAPVLTLTPSAAGILEGTRGTTATVTYAVSLSATSAVDVSVNYATSNGTAMAADNDYISTGGTLTIPAGSVTGQIAVQVIGDNKYESNEVFYVNLSNAVNVTLGTAQVSCTITNDDFAFYVRGDGLGSDANDGGDWQHAFASLQRALTNVPYDQAFTVYVQASIGTQSYATCTRNDAGFGSPGHSIGVSFLGGWQNVDSAAVQSGMSSVQDPATNNPGFRWVEGGSHYLPKTLLLDRFAFSNVTMGVVCSNSSAMDQSGIILALSNCTISAQSHGVFVYYPKAYSISSGIGGLVRVQAVNVDVLAGLGGAGDGIHAEGTWTGSCVTASGTDPATGAPRVSSIRSLTGQGVSLTAYNNGETCGAVFSNTAIYGCASNGVHLDVDYNTNATPYLVQATFRNCTIADNGANGLDMLSQTSNSWASITNCIFAGNGVHALCLSSTNSAFTFGENYNVFFGNDRLVNGSAPQLGANTFTSNPIFYGRDPRPSPWYMLNSKLSPAYLNGTDGQNRGAYQGVMLPPGVVFTFH